MQGHWFFAIQPLPVRSSNRYPITQHVFHHLLNMEIILHLQETKCKTIKADNCTFKIRLYLQDRNTHWNSGPHKYDLCQGLNKCWYKGFHILGAPYFGKDMIYLKRCIMQKPFILQVKTRVGIGCWKCLTYHRTVQSSTSQAFHLPVYIGWSILRWFCKNKRIWSFWCSSTCPIHRPWWRSQEVWGPYSYWKMVLRAAAHILMSRISMKQDMLKYIINTFGKDMGIRNSGAQLHRD